MLLGSVVAACADGGGEPAPVGLLPGNRAPPLEGVAVEGGTYRLAERAGNHLVLFYRGGHCGLCRLRLEELTRRFPEYRALGFDVVAVTADPPVVAAATASQVGAEFPIVSVDSAALRQWGMAAGGGDGTGPLFGAFLLDGDGILIHARRSAVGADRIRDAELLAFLEQRRDDHRAPQ